MYVDALIQFGPGGHAYVYMCYGLHVMLNVVADKEGIGAAVLIRSCSPISGIPSRYLSGFPPLFLLLDYIVVRIAFFIG